MKLANLLKAVYFCFCS